MNKNYREKTENDINVDMQKWKINREAAIIVKILMCMLAWVCEHHFLHNIFGEEFSGDTTKTR